MEKYLLTMFKKYLLKLTLSIKLICNHFQGGLYRSLPFLIFSKLLLET